MHFLTSRFHNFGTKLKLENKTDIFPAGTLLAIDIPTFKANPLTCGKEYAYLKPLCFGEIHHREKTHERASLCEVLR